MRVLVLEDDDDLRASLVDLMLLEGAEGCVAARSFAELEAQAEAALGCGVAILDVNLGEGVPSGIDAYRWLRARGFGGRIVLLTGHAASHPLVRQASALAEATVLAKPLGVDRLRALVGAAGAKG